MPQSWGLRSWRSWLSIVLVATTTLVVSDRAAAAITTDQIHDRVADELAANNVTYGSLSVDVAGTPFLTQVATGTLDRISISMNELRPSGLAPAATITSVDVVASGVRLNIGNLLRGGPAATAQQVEGTAVISYAALDGLVALPGLGFANVHFSESDGGGLQFDALGGLAPVHAEADVTVEDGRLRVRLRDARFVSLILPPGSSELLDQILALTIDVLMPELPLGLTLQSLTPGPVGLSISVVGHDVPLTAD